MGKQYIHLRCRSCGKRMRAPTHAAGKASKCPQCQHRFVVPTKTATARPSSEPANTSTPGRSRHPSAGTAEASGQAPGSTESSETPRSDGLAGSETPSSSPESGNHALLSRSRRYKVLAPDKVRLSVRVEGAAELISAQLLDISKGGIKIAIPTSLSGHPQLTVTVESDVLPTPLILATQIHWARPAEGGGCMVGGAFAPPIPDGQFRSLLDSGLLERRAFPRQEIHTVARVHWELGDSSIEAEVRDLSQEGFRLVMRQRGDRGQRTIVGARVLVNVEDCDVTTPVIGQAQWEEDSDEGTLVGCSFVDDRAYHEWKRLLTASQDALLPAEQPTGRHRRRWWPWLLALVLVAGMGGGAGWLFFTGQLSWEQMHNWWSQR